MSEIRAPARRREWRHRLFLAAVILKGVDGALEVGGGALLLAFGPQGLGQLVGFLTRSELAEDPRDLLAGWLVRHARTLGIGTAHFAAAYLLAHGAIKLFLAGGLLRERRWVFPVALVLMILFLAFQLTRLVQRPSGSLAALSIVDVVIIALVWREYRAVRAGAFD